MAEMMKHRSGKSKVSYPYETEKDGKMFLVKHIESEHPELIEEEMAAEEIASEAQLYCFTCRNLLARYRRFRGDGIKVD